MYRIIDEIALCLFCLVVASANVPVTAVVVSLLFSVIMCCWNELVHKARLRPIVPLAFAVAICVNPSFVVFCPIVAYVLFREEYPVLRLVWIIPLLCAARELDTVLLGFVALLCILAYVMAWRTARASAEREHYRKLRDELWETSLALKGKNRDLMERRDYEVRLATLSERGRIAREIHDNVGHLLTRSVLQVEAMQVVHADDSGLKEELSSVGTTLHEALDTVRASVHDLHEDAFDLQTQLEQVVDACSVDEAQLTYDVDSMSSSLSYAVLAVVKEALSNVDKHSDATRVDVTIIEKPAFYQVTIQDNGSRKSKGAADESVGIGLSTMRERIESFDGRFLSEYRNGWRVFASIPKQEELS